MKKSQIYLGFVALIFTFGTFQGLRRGGEDFLVFYSAARLSLTGLGHEIYVNSPDRYLYAPGFAWLLAPLAILPWKIAFPLWCALKALSFGGMVKVLAKRFSPLAVLLGVLFFARPLLNELRYGQVNLLIVTLSVWAFDALMSEGVSRPKKFWSWFCFSIAAVAKLFPAVLIWIPFLPYPGDRKNRMPVRLGIFIGIFILFFVPVLTQGFSGLVQMYQSWQQALVSKGFPLETHNQSFLAFLFHSFSGETFYSLMRGPTPYNYSWWVMPKAVLYGMGLIWSLAAGLALLIGCYFCGLRRDFALALVLLAGSILPSHLIWKPYLVFALPLAVLMAHVCISKKKGYWVYAFGIVLINFTSFDFIGRALAATFEAHAIYFWMVIALLVGAWIQRKVIFVSKSVAS